MNRLKILTGGRGLLQMPGWLVGAEGGYGRAVVVHQPPAAVVTLEDIGGLHLGAGNAIVRVAGNVLGAYHPSNVADHGDLYGGEVEHHFECVLKDPSSALHHGCIAKKPAPSRVCALYPRRMEPDVFHPLRLKALKGAIEGLVRSTNVVRFARRCHRGGGAMKTSRASRSGPRLVTAWSALAG